jgi:hypothetical protein
MARSKGRAWKNERASVTVSGRSRPRSNKYSHSDSHQRPAAHTRDRVWVAAYTRSDGRHVEGHYRDAPGA